MRVFIIATASLLAAGVANAAIIPTLTGPPTAIGGGEYSFVYRATLPSDAALQAGNFFTLYDLGGWTGFGALPANWTTSTEFVGITAPDVTPADDASLINATFTYTGPTLNLGMGEMNSEVDLGLFEIFSSFGNVRTDNFSSEAVRNSGSQAGSSVSAIGDVGVPGVPEPASWAMLIAGFGLVGASMRRRRNQPTVVTG